MLIKFCGKTCLALAIAALWFLPLRANHIMGGDLTYKNVGNNRVAVEFMIYRDCNAANGSALMPDSVYYYIYTGTDVVNKAYNNPTKRTAKRVFFAKVNPEIPHCTAPSGVCVQQGIFRDTFTVGNDSIGYHVVYYSVRRNVAIDNIQGINNPCPPFGTKYPGGSIWYTFIPPKTIVNSSPQFLTKPIPYLCVGKKNIFNPLVSDADKDSLVFSLETPYSPSSTSTCGLTNPPIPYPPGHSDFSKLTYKSGYSNTNPFGGTSSISINAVTGEITASPSTSGNYVIAVQIKEYRVNPVTKKAIYVGEIRRDLQFVVGTCPSNFAPQYTKDTIGLTRYIDPGGKLCFTVEGNDPSDTLYLTGSSGIFKNGATISAPYATFQGDTAKGKVTSQFCWSPTCDHITYTSPYIVTFSLADNNCNQVFRTYSIYVRTRAILSPPAIHCVDVIDDNTIKLTISDSLSKDTVRRLSFKQYKIYRRPQGGAFTLVDSINSYKTTTWTDKKVSNASTIFYSYYITTQNSCDLEGLSSDTVNSLIVLGQQLSDRRVKFSWPKQRSRSGIKYKIYADDGSGFALIDSTTALSKTYFFCNKTRRIKVRVDDTSCTSNSLPSPKMTIKDVTAPNSKGDAIAYAIHTSGSDLKANDGTFIQVPHTDSSDVKAIYIQRSDNGGAFTTIDTFKTPSPITKTYTRSDTAKADLKNRYKYRFVFLDSCGNSGNSSTFAIPFLSGKAGQMRSSLTWKPAEGFTVTGIKVKRYNGNIDFSKEIDVATLSTTDTQYVDTGLTCGKAYFYQVTYDYKIGATAYSTGSNVIQLIPFDSVKPLKLKVHYVTVKDNKTTYITWTKTKDKDVKEYIISRYTVGSAAVFRDTIFQDTSYIDTGLNVMANTYYYQVQAIDTCPNNVSPASDKFSTVFLGVSRIGCTQKLKLDWTFINPWPEGVKQYTIYRKIKGGTEALYATVNASTKTYTDASVDNKHRYIYRIEAMQLNGKSYIVSSNTIDTFPFKPETPVITSVSKLSTSTTSGSIQVTWVSQKNSPQIKYQELYYKGPGTPVFTLLQGNISPSTNSYTQNNLNTKTQDHQYLLLSFDSCGNMADSSAIHKSMNLDLHVGQLIHALQWTPYKGWPVKWYELQSLQGGNWVAVDTAKGTDTAFTRFPAPCNRPVFFRVRAIGANGYSAISDTAGGTALDTIPANAPLFQNASVFDNGKIQLDFRGSDSADVYGYAIMRSTDGGAWKNTGFVPYTTAGAKHTAYDLTNTQDYSYCYQVQTLDSCLNATPSQTFCTVQLKGQPLNQAEKLSWHPFKGYTLNEYQLQKYNGTAWNTIKILAPTDTSAAFDPQPCYVENIYRIRGIEKSGTRVTLSDSLHITPFDTIVPSAPVMHYASVIPGKGYKLSWSWDKKSDVKYFDVYRIDPDSSSPTHLATVMYDSTYLDMSPSALNKVYSYYVTARDSCNSTHISSPSDIDRVMEISGTTLDCVPLARLKWTAYYELEKKTDGYIIYRSQGAGTPQIVKAVDRNTLSYVDSTVLDSVKYVYYIIAADSSTQYFSRSDTISVFPTVYAAPQPVDMIYTTVTNTGTIDGEIEMKWVAVQSNDIYAGGYHIYMGTKPGGPYTLVYTEPDKAVTTFTHKGIDTRNTEHCYYVANYNICGAEARHSLVHHAVNLTVTNNNLQAQLKWNRYTGFPVDYYEVEKSVDGTPLFVISSGGPVDTTYTDTNMYCGHVYTYRIHGINANGLETYSDTVTITAYDNTAPAKPDIRVADVTATGAGNGQVTITFKAASDKNRKGYIVYRSDKGGAYKALDTLNIVTTGTLQYTDNNLDTRGETHAWYIRSYDSCGNISQPSDTHAVVLLDVTPQNDFNHLNWSAYKGFGPKRYAIERRNSGSAWLRLATTTLTQFDDNNVRCDSIYEYRVLTLENATGYASTSNTDSALSFESNKPVVPVITVATVTKTDTTAGTIKLSWKASASVDVKQYTVYHKQGNGPWTLAATLLPGSTSYTDTGLNTYRQIYQYKVLAEDSCKNPSLDNSEIHRPVSLRASQANEAVRLDWTAYNGFTVTVYEIYRNGALVTTVTPQQLSYLDTNLICTNTYTYLVKALAMDNSISESNTDSLKPYDTRPPQPIRLVTATVSIPNTEALVQWTKANTFDAKGYEVYRRNSGSGGMKLVYKTADINDTTHQDNFALSEGQACYFVSVKDACGNLSAMSNAGCLIVLSGNAGKLQNHLEWTPYRHWTGDVKLYNVYRHDSTGWNLLHTVDRNTFTYLDSSLSDFVPDYCYRVEAIENAGSAISQSTTICLAQSPVVWMPNAFTPDDTKVNDFFGPQGNYIQRYDMQIFNRWGQLVYSTEEGKPWDGYVNGKRAPMGVYLYRVTVHGYDVTKQYFQGVVTLLK